jgi:Na+/melibiose symporter-like transporter
MIMIDEILNLIGAGDSASFGVLGYVVGLIGLVFGVLVQFTTWRKAEREAELAEAEALAAEEEHRLRVKILEEQLEGLEARK